MAAADLCMGSHPVIENTVWKRGYPRYLLTGVGVRDVNVEPMTVLTDPNKTYNRARMCRGRGLCSLSPTKICIQCVCQPTHHCGWESRHGFYIHAHCWNLIERVIGPQVRRQLDALVEAMTRVWKRSYPEEPYGLKYLMEPGDRVPYFTWTGDMLAVDPEKFPVTRPIQYVATRLTDPLDAPNLQTLVNSCKSPSDSPSDSRKKAVSSIKSRRQHCKQPRPTSRDKLRSPPNLPMDIQEMILDELCATTNLSDAANAVDVFHWYLPDRSWKKRLPLDIIVELDGISSKAYFDWRRFFIGLGRLSNGSYALDNRKRIFAVLGAIREEFLSIVPPRKRKRASKS